MALFVAPDGVSIGAGTQTALSGTVVLSNSNGISFGMSGSSRITASYTVPSTAGLISAVNVSAGTTSTNATAFTFANANGVSFGLNGQTITASVAGAGGGGVAIAGGTQTATSGTVVFSNSNGISFGLSGSTRMTASYTVPSTAGLISAVNVSAGTTSNNLSALTYANANGVSFGLNASTVTASVAAGATATGNFGALGAGTQTATSGTVVFSDSNGISFGMSGSSRITASYTVPSTAGLISAVNVSAGTTSNNLSALTYANANGVSFGLNASTVTASVAAGATATGNFGALGAGTQTATSGTVVFSDSNGISFGMSGSSRITASYTVPSTAGLISAVNFSAGTTSTNATAVTFGNANGFSFGLNAGTITGSYTVPTVPSIATQVYDVGSAGSTGTVTRYAPEDHRHAGVFYVAAGSNTGNTLGNTTPQHGAWVIAGTGNITISGSTGGAGVHTAWVSGSQSTAPGAIAGGTQTATSGTVVFSNSNGISFGLSGSTRMTADFAAIKSISAGTTRATNGEVVFGDGGGITFGMNGNTLTATVVPGAAAGIAAIGAGTQTATSGTILFKDGNNVTFGMSGTAEVTASANPGVSALSAGTQSANSGLVEFKNQNGISFGLSASSIMTASHNGITTPIVTLSSYMPWPFVNTGTGALGLATNTSTPMTLLPFNVPVPVFAEALRAVVSMSFQTGGTSSYNQSGTLQWGLYSRETGTNSTRLVQMGSSSFSYGVSYNNSTISISQVSTTNFGSADYSYVQTTSAGLNISSGYTGFKLMWLKLNSTLTQGAYWLGLHHRNSSSSFNSGLRMSFFGHTETVTGLAPMGSFSSAWSTGTNVPGQLGGNFLAFGGSYSVAALTQLQATVTISQLTQNVGFQPWADFVTRMT